MNGLSTNTATLNGLPPYREINPIEPWKLATNDRGDLLLTSDGKTLFRWFDLPINIFQRESYYSIECSSDWTLDRA